MSGYTKTLPPFNGDFKKRLPPYADRFAEPSETQTTTNSANASPFQLAGNPRGDNPSRSRTLFPSPSPSTVPASTDTGSSIGKMNMAFSGTPQSDSFQSQLRNGGEAQLGIRQRHGAGEAKTRDEARRVNLPPPKTSRLSAVFGHTESESFITQTAKESNMTNQSTKTNQPIIPSEIAQTSKNSHKNNDLSWAKTHQDYSKWLVVYGFTDWKQCQSMLTHFESFGTISSRYPSSLLEERDVKSNWVCLRYDSALQADKAFCQHGCFLDANSTNGKGDLKHQQQDSNSNEFIIIGVMRVDMDVAVRLGLRNHIEFGISGGIQKEKFVAPTSGVNTKTKTTQRKVPLEEKDVLLSKKDESNNAASDVSNYAANGLMAYFLAWMFSW